MKNRSNSSNSLKLDLQLPLAGVEMLNLWLTLTEGGEVSFLLVGRGLAKMADLNVLGHDVTMTNF